MLMFPFCVETAEVTRGKAKQPNTPSTDISDSDPSLSSQAQVGDGMNNSQVTLHTGQEVKEYLSIPGEGPNTKPHH